MGVEVEIIQPEGFQAEPEQVESSDSLQTGSPLVGYAAAALALIVITAFLFSLGGNDETSQRPTTTLAPQDDGFTNNQSVDPENDPDGGHNAEYQSRRTTITEWPGGQSLIVIENSQFIYEIDLATGRRTSWSPPELLIDADPLVVDREVVVIGESGAWIGQPFTAQWRFLADANRVMPSSWDDRFWLQTELPIPDPAASRFQWTEIDATGKVFRTVLRDEPVTLATPELVVGSDGVVMRLTAGESRPWRTLTDNGAVVASGLNDLILAECTPDGRDCGRVWYGPRSRTPKTGFYPDLAENIVGPVGSLLSPDGRFVVSASGVDQNEVAIVSVANGRTIGNQCIPSSPVIWTADSELLACATSAGAELISTDDGRTLGMAVTGSDKWTRMAFIPTQRLAQLR